MPPTYLAPQKHDDVLEVMVANPRLPLEFVDHSPARFCEQFYFLNPLKRPIEAGQGFGRGTLAPGFQDRASPLDLLTRPAKPIRTEMAYGFNVGTSNGFLIQRTYLVATNPLAVDVAPAGDSGVLCRIENISQEPFSGSVRLVAAHSDTISEEPLTFASGEREKTVLLKYGGAIPNAELEVKILEPGRKLKSHDGDGVWYQDAGDEVLEIPLGSPRPMDPEILVNAKLTVDGDPKIASEQEITNVASAPESSPAGGEYSKLRYKFGHGWKFLRLATSLPFHTNSPDFPDAPQGYPKRFGVWLHGDGGLCVPRIRFVDATGQTFQSDGPKIDWKGWRFVEFSLRVNSQKPLGHWGGANDGTIHYPIKWDSIFLLDNISREPVEGEIYLSAPTLIF